MAVGVERTTQRIRISDTHILVPNGSGGFMAVPASVASENLKQYPPPHRQDGKTFLDDPSTKNYSLNSSTIKYIKQSHSIKN